MEQDENLPAQCHPIIKTKKKKSEIQTDKGEKNEAV